MKKIIDFIQFNGKALVLIIAIVTAFMSVRLCEIEMKEDEETFISPNNPVLKQFREFKKTFESNEGVIVAFETPNVFTVENFKYIGKLEAELSKLPGVIKVSSLISANNVNGVDEGLEIYPIINQDSLTDENVKRAKVKVIGNEIYEGVYVSQNHKVTALIVELSGMFSGGSDSLAKHFYKKLTNLVNSQERETGLRIYVGGDIVTDASIEQLMDKDLALLFPLSLLLSAIILLFFYRKLITTVVPLVPVLIAIVWVLGLKGWTGVPMTPISITLFPLIMVIGLANSIHIINHYKRERQIEGNNSEAITKTLAAIIKPCFLAAFTTAIGFGSLAISNVTGIRQMGVFAAFGVMSAFLLSIVIIPFSLKYSKVFTISKPNKQVSSSFAKLLLGIDKLNHLHSWKVIIVFIAITIVMGIYIPKIKVEGSMASFAKENTRLRQDIKFLDSNMSGINAFELIIKGSENSFKNPENLANLNKIACELSKTPEVLKTFSTADMVKTINKALHANNSAYHSIPLTETEIAQYLFLYEISGGEELRSFAKEDYSVARLTIRTSQMPNKKQKEFVSSLENLLLSNFVGMDCEITGFGMLMNHINENLISTQVESILMAFGLILFLMFIMFGFKGGLLSILPNIFPILFFMGLMGIFGIDLNMATSIIAAVTIGIVVDDTIHFFYGYKNEMYVVNNSAISVTNTMLKVGAALCVTSLILTLGFGILVFSNSKFIGDFGIMSASAIASALLGDIFISPIVLIKSKLFKK